MFDYRRQVFDDLSAIGCRMIVDKRFTRDASSNWAAQLGSDRSAIIARLVADPLRADQIRTERKNSTLSSALIGLFTILWAWHLL